MPLYVELRPSVIAVRVALASLTGQSGRLCRVVLCFPDLGLVPFTEKLGYVPWTTQSQTSELVHEHQPELTTIIERQ
jgi:hypothetical protein